MAVVLLVIMTCIMDRHVTHIAFTVYHVAIHAMVLPEIHLYARVVTMVGMLMDRNARLAVVTARMEPTQNVTLHLVLVKLSVKGDGLVKDVIAMSLIVKYVLIKIRTFAQNVKLDFIVKRIPLVPLVQVIV